MGLAFVEWGSSLVVVSASHCCGFLLQSLGLDAQAFVVAVAGLGAVGPGLQSTGSMVVAQRLGCLWDLPGPGSNLLSCLGRQILPH